MARQHRLTYRCSFCGKAQEQVKRLIAGPAGVYICDECIDLCQEIVDEEKGIAPSKEPVVHQNREDLLQAGSELIDACASALQALDEMVKVSSRYSGVLPPGFSQTLFAAITHVSGRIGEHYRKLIPTVEDGPTTKEPGPRPEESTTE